jgi:hypothetical protein
MSTGSKPLVLPSAPPDRTQRVRVLGALVGVIAAVVLGVSGAPELSALVILLAAAFQYLLFWSRRREVGVHLALAALDRASRGRFDDARAILDAVPPQVLGGVVGQMVHAQRAAMALYEGKLEDAVSFATRAAKDGARLAAHEAIHRGSALSIRAVALAALGRDEEALADVRAVRGADLRQAGFVARAALAEAMILARRKNIDQLAELVRAERPLLFGATSPRERLVARALARLVSARKRHVYREPAQREADALDGEASWVAKLAPEAASYAKSATLGTATDAPEPVDPATTQAAIASGPKAKRGTKTFVAIFVGLLVAFAAIFQVFGVGGGPELDEMGGARARSPWPALAATYVVALGALASFVLVRRRRAFRESAALGAAIEARLRGEHERARTSFTELAKSPILLVRPQALRELATIAFFEGDFRLAERHAADGIEATQTSEASLALSRPVALPMLHGELGVALAAQGRLSRAEEEVELVRRTFPTYPFMAKDAFRVRIVAAVASGRLDDAARLARERPTDLPLGLEEELLCDALRVCANDTLPEGERDRILDELREDSASTRWLDALSPGVRAGATGKRMRVGPSEAEIPDASYEAEPGGRAEDEEHEEEEEEEEAPRARSRGREL